MKKLLFSVVTILSLIGAPAHAAKRIELQPSATEGQTVRYEKGTPTVEDDVVRIMPLRDLDHGSMQFLVAVYNSGQAPLNFGVENIQTDLKGQTLAVFTRDDLEKKAKNRARWSQIGYALLAGAATASQSNSYTATTYTPRGVYHTVINRPGLSNGQIATMAAGGGAIALSEIGLQRTLEALGDEILQTTTVDPDSGYGGRIVLAKAKKLKKGDILTFNVDAGGSTRTFQFLVK